jgi:hypothetical protein
MFLSGLDSGIGGGESGGSTLQYMEKQNHNVAPNQPLAFWPLNPPIGLKRHIWVQESLLKSQKLHQTLLGRDPHLDQRVLSSNTIGDPKS